MAPPPQRGDVVAELLVTGLTCAKEPLALRDRIVR
jgi:hypothetical protein